MIFPPKLFYPKLYLRKVAYVSTVAGCLKTDTGLDSVSATGSEFQRVGPEYIRLDLNKSNLGMGTLSFLE